MLVLDTDHLSVLEWEASTTTQRLLKRLSLTAPDEAATTIINGVGRDECQSPSQVEFLLPII